MYPLPRLLTDVLPAAEQRVGLHHRSPAPAVGIVIHLLLLVYGVVPDLMALHPDIPPLLAPAQNGFAQHISHHIRE